MSRVLLSIGVVHVLTMLVGLMRAKSLSVLLGPADFGVLSTVDQAVLSVVQLGALSLPFTAMKYMSQGHSEGPEQFVNRGWQPALFQRHAAQFPDRCA